MHLKVNLHICVIYKFSILDHITDDERGRTSVCGNMQDKKHEIREN